VPVVAFANPAARPGGKALPRDAFFRDVDGVRRRLAAR
jgi:hypothetical protein